jgi:hypothetical protein
MGDFHTRFFLASLIPKREFQSKLIPSCDSTILAHGVLYLSHYDSCEPALGEDVSYLY